jgi:CubicO group peptidase (beta-lactamase class C family)
MVNNRIQLCISVCFAFLFINSIVFAQRIDSDLYKRYSDYLEIYYQNKRIPSISAGVLKDGIIQWLDAKGQIDLETFTPAKPSSLYRIASITKAITAVAVMQLYEKGQINLDADINTYVPYFPQKKWKVTVRNLLNHTSGIRSYKSEEEFNSKMFYSSTKEAVMTFANDDLLFEPGTNYNYSSLGYSLLAALIENVTKMSFESYLRKEIFQVANMKSTRVDRQRDVIFERAKGYDKSSDRKFINSPLADLSIKVAGGGLISTSEDILLFAKALLEGNLISKSTLEMMTKPVVLKNGKRFNYGFGLSLSDPGDSLSYFGHEGRGTGFVSGLIIEPSSATATVFLINVRDRNLGNPARDLLLISKGYNNITITQTVSDFLFDKYYSGGIDSVISNFNFIYDNRKSEFNLSDEECAYFGQALVEIRSIVDAIRYLRMLNRKIPNSFPILKALGNAYFRDGNNGFALRYFREAQLIKSDDSQVNRMINVLSRR